MKKKAFLTICMSLLVIALVVFTLLHLTTGSTQAHAAQQPTSTQQSTSNSASEPEWIVKATPYVHVANGIATIDPAITKVLSASDLARVTQAIQKYNSLPYATKMSVAVTKSVAVQNISMNRNVTPNDYCPSGSGAVSGPYHYWWGTAWTFNHCLVQQLWIIIYIDGSVATGIGIICGALTAGACAIFAGLAGTVIVGTVVAMQSADAQCNNRGANLNLTYAGIFFVNSVC